MLDELLARLATGTVVAVSPAEVEELLAGAEVLRQEKPALAGPIRVLIVDRQVVVQEQTPEGEALIRRLPSRADAERFVSDRLDAYERMWDG